MKVLSVRQPWAFAILALGKDVENRSWTTGHRGPLLIHAAMTYDVEGERALFDMGLEVPGYEVPSVRRGGIVGAVDLIASVPRLAPERVALGPLSGHEERIARSRWYRGDAAAWLVERPLMLPFYPTKGHLNLFDFEEGRLPKETRAALEAWLAIGANPKLQVVHG